MDNFHGNRRVCWYCMMVGFALMNTALFLHPMSPEDFLGLACYDPLFTILDGNGGAMAVFFWISVALMLFGVAGLLGRSRAFQRMLPTHKLDLQTHIK